MKDITPAEAMRAAREAAEHTDPDPDIELKLIAERYTPVDWRTAWLAKPVEVDWLVRPFIEAGTVNALYATPGTGKSLIALEWSLRLVRQDRAVLYIDEENRLTEDIVDRLQSMGATPDELGKLTLYSFASLPPLDTPVGGIHLLALAVAARAELVVIDTASRMIAGGENDSDTWLKLYQNSVKPLKGRGIAVLRIDHPGKDADRGQRGSSAKTGDVDTVWKLHQIEQGKPYFRMECEKSRSGHIQRGDVIMVERRFAPTRHVWEPAQTVRDARDRSPETPRVQVLAEALDKAGIPPSAGRDRCRTALDSLGIPASTALLTEVVKHRKTRPDSSGQLASNADSRTAESTGGELSAALPPYRGEQADRSASTSPRPPCDHTECHDALLGACLGDEGRAAQRKLMGWEKEAS